MNCKTLSNRLAIYRKTLEHYTYAHSKGYPYAATQTGRGFCAYFFYVHNKFIHWLPELLLQKPNDREIANFWFDENGPTTKRIECLQRAIELCEINLDIIE